MATNSDDGAQVTKEASLLGISVELRLKVYSFLLKREGPIDTLLHPVNEQMIWRNARLANAADANTSLKIWAELRRWDERNVFFVCRLLLGEASEYFYHNNTFDFYSPTQCLTWLGHLHPWTRNLVRHIAIPYINVRPAFENQALMASLCTIAPEVRTIYLGTKLNVSAGGREPRYWDKWVARWGIAAATTEADDNKLTIKWEDQDGSAPPGGPYRKIVAAKPAVAELGDEEEHGNQRGIERSTMEDLGDLNDISDGLAKMLSLRTVYLSPGFEPCWDAKLTHVLARVEEKRDTAEAHLV